MLSCTLHSHSKSRSETFTHVLLFANPIHFTRCGHCHWLSIVLSTKLCRSSLWDGLKPPHMNSKSVRKYPLDTMWNLHFDCASRHAIAIYGASHSDCFLYRTTHPPSAGSIYFNHFTFGKLQKDRSTLCSVKLPYINIQLIRQ